MRISKSAPRILFGIIVAVVSSRGALTAAKSSFVAPGATIKLVQSGFQGAEDPAVDADGNVYCSAGSLHLLAIAILQRV
jgi:hypothetical protein